MELVPSQRGRLSLAFREIANSVPNSGMTTTVVDEHDSLSVGRAGATIAHVVALCSVFPTPRSHRGVGFSGRGHVAAFSDGVVCGLICLDSMYRSSAARVTMTGERGASPSLLASSSPRLMGRAARWRRHS